MVTLVNRAKMSTATTGTGIITLGSAITRYQTFAAGGVADGDTVRYVIEDGSNWEIGSGLYTASGTTLSRTVLESSNSGSAISLSGEAIIFVGATTEDLYPANDLFYENSTTINANYTVTANRNSLSAGPITISSGFTVTVPSGSRWVVV
tara:strand:+ start:973 stop:1422 length:450 start_codon:yes stop_codon:yes gene_type:complete